MYVGFGVDGYLYVNKDAKERDGQLFSTIRLVVAQLAGVCISSAV